MEIDYYVFCLAVVHQVQPDVVFKGVFVGGEGRSHFAEGEREVRVSEDQGSWVVRGVLISVRGLYRQGWG